MFTQFTSSHFSCPPVLNILCKTGKEGTARMSTRFGANYDHFVFKRKADCHANLILPLITQDGPYSC